MIRKAVREDLPQISRLIKLVIDKVVAEYYSPDIIRIWKDYVSLPKLEAEFKDMLFLVYEVDNSIVGVGAMRGAHIEKVYVDPNYQRRGIGRYLMQRLEGFAKNNWVVECDLNSTCNAIDFCKRIGYKDMGPITMTHGGLSVTFTRMTKQI
ncbi:hypothetical protein A3K72_02880 [Candidatus Woesearchaeota archaeon RBG_13_36_6]|nr:MAG: hypothetical protein A3K72_02880 [Candidatus Woesearchaeota archaeon RBG_13_36_6]